MGLTYRKEEQLKKQPIIESRVRKSADGKLVVMQTIITKILPVAYLDKVLAGEEEELFQIEA